MPSCYLGTFLSLQTWLAASASPFPLHTSPGWRERGTLCASHELQGLPDLGLRRDLEALLLGKYGEQEPHLCLTLHLLTQKRGLRHRCPTHPFLQELWGTPESPAVHLLPDACFPKLAGEQLSGRKDVWRDRSGDCYIQKASIKLVAEF